MKLNEDFKFKHEVAVIENDKLKASLNKAYKQIFEYQQKEKLDVKNEL